MSTSSPASASLSASHPPSTSPEKPVPRQRKSPAHSAQVQVQNRRREYLQRHPGYLTNIEHELAGTFLLQESAKFAWLGSLLRES